MCQFSFLFSFFSIPLLKFDRQSLSSRVIVISESSKWLTQYEQKISMRANFITVDLTFRLKVLIINKSQNTHHKYQ